MNCSAMDMISLPSATGWSARVARFSSGMLVHADDRHAVVAEHEYRLRGAVGGPDLLVDLGEVLLVVHDREVGFADVGRGHDPLGQQTVAREHAERQIERVASVHAPAVRELLIEEVHEAAGGEAPELTVHAAVG